MQIKTTLNDYTWACKSFAKESGYWKRGWTRESNKFYTTIHGDRWIESCDNAHGGLDVSWAHGLSAEYINEHARYWLIAEIRQLIESIDNDNLLITLEIK